MSVENKINPDLHIICGKCGRKSMLSYSITNEKNDESGEDEIKVYVFCDNCGTSTRLDEIIEEKKLKTKHMADKKKIVEFVGWRVSEVIEFEGNAYTRIDDVEEGINWFRFEDGGNLDCVIGEEDPELDETLEKKYQKSKQGYAYGFKK